MFFQWIFVGFGAVSAAAGGATPSMGPCDAWFTATAQPKGVVILAHGMNLKPACMDTMAKELAVEGYEVLRPAFSGHCGGNENYLNVTAEQWEADARRVYALASSRASMLSKPVFLVSYSFTAAIFQSMSKELPFARRVYLAPALAPKFWYPAVRWFASTFPGFTYSSKNVPQCAANLVSGSRAILAYDHFLGRWKKGDGKTDTTPILALAEPEDELVSYQGLVTIAADKNNWVLERVSNRGHTMPETYHHLIVDPPSLGQEEWIRVMGMIRAFLAK